MRGLFIVFEGLDGSGQDTQAELLKTWFEEKGFSVWLTREPTEDSGPGQQVRKILRKEIPKPSANMVQYLMSSDRGCHDRTIRQQLTVGKVIICVRYLYSTLAYGQADGVGYEYLWGMNQNYVRPDLAIYLDIAPEVAIKRINLRGKPIELFEQKEFLTKVRNNFLGLIQQSDDFPELRLINAGADIESVCEQVIEQIELLLKSVK